MASKAMRVIVFVLKSSARRRHYRYGIYGRQFDILGMVGIMDPPRAEVYDAIYRCQKAGIAVKMITGDQQMTAQAIGEDLNITKPHIDSVGGEN